MKISFVVEYDTEVETSRSIFGSSAWTIKDVKNCEIVHSGSSYLRVKSGEVLLGDIHSETEHDMSTLHIGMWKKKKEEENE